MPPHSLRILLVEDNPADARYLRELLSQSVRVWHDVAHCATLAAALKHVAEKPVDVILLDLSLPDESGLDTLTRMRAGGIHTPVVVLTGLDDENLATRAIQAGAQDYLIKGGVNAQILERSLRHALERHRAEERYRHLFERNLAGVYRMTLDGQILDCNPAFAQMLGYNTAEELRGLDISPLHIDPSRKVASQRLLSQQVLSAFEVAFDTRDGRRIWALVNENLTLDEQGAWSTIEGTLVDITERKQLEAQLRQVQKMEAVGRLAGGVAHDFNNLLTIISSYGDLALEQVSDSDPLYEPLQEIRNASARAASLTRQLLAFSRQQVLVPNVLDLNSVVGNVESMLRRLIGEHIELVTVRDEPLGYIKADSGQLEQVLLNLSINARDAMPDGGTLRIETANAVVTGAGGSGSPPPGRYVRLTVTDNGVGMDTATLGRVFEPFFTTKEVGKGTGLGLATVYGIVRQSGGYIDVNSAPGQGASFTIFLPVVDEPVSINLPKPAAVAAQGVETILLVEDDEAVRKLARRVLATRGYRVMEAAHGEDALRISVEHPGPIHLLLTDITMPQMSGRELAQRLSAEHPEVRVLYMSGHTDDVRIRGMLPETWDRAAFLQKPFTPELLARRVRGVLDRRDAQVQASD